MDMTRCLVLQHIACEPPGAYEDVLREHGATLDRIELDEGDRLPDWHDYDAIIAMGGPMSANDDAELPWLTREKALIREAVGAGVPFFGVCLGAQLLAASLGAAVYAGPRQEVGVLPVALMDEGRADPVLGALSAEFLTLQWHADTFELPPGAVHLASSPAYPNQAFRVGAAYGVQFHLEVSADMAAEWARVPAYAESLERVHGAGALPRLLEEFELHRDEMLARARDAFERWLGGAVEARRRGAGRPAAR
jgi:GMP synthase (glutamine-hydrolysing)